MKKMVIAYMDYYSNVLVQHIVEVPTNGTWKDAYMVACDAGHLGSPLVGPEREEELRRITEMPTDIAEANEWFYDEERLFSAIEI